MKKAFICCIGFLSLAGFSQALKDSTRLVLIGNGDITYEQVLLADSLLLGVIGFHNQYLDRQGLATLTVDELTEYQALVVRRSRVTPCIRENGKLSYHRLYELYPKGPLRDSVYADYGNLSAIDRRICELEENGRKSPLILAWSQSGPIDLSSYYRQYDYSIDQKGQVLVHVICICDDIMTQLERKPGFVWGSKMYTVEENSSCVFSVHMNLTRHQVVDLYVNGPRL